MNLCYISNSATPSDNANSLQIIKMCEHLKKLGHEVTLVLPNTGFKVSLIKFYNIRNRFNLIRCKKFNQFPIGMMYYLYSIKSIMVTSKLKIDYFITRNFFTAFLLLILNKKVIFELHTDLNLEGRIVRFLVKKFKFLKYKNLVKLICITKGVKNYYLKEKLIDSSKTIILPSSSDLFLNFNFKKRFKKKLNIGYFGSMYNSRGSSFIYKLAKLDFQNDYHIYSKSFSKKINFIKNLYFHNFVDRKKIINEINKMDILVMPYQDKITVKGDVGDITNFTSPMKMFDYMASGKLIISSNIKVLQEILKDKKNCIFIKNYKNLFNWKMTINKFKNNISNYNILSKNSYVLSKQYTYDLRAQKMLKGL